MFNFEDFADMSNEHNEVAVPDVNETTPFEVSDLRIWYISFERLSSAQFLFFVSLHCHLSLQQAEIDDLLLSA